MKRFSFLLIVSLLSCTGDAVAPIPEAIQASFCSSAIQLDENGPGMEIPIQLSKVAPGPGTIEISVSSDLANYGEHFTTIPQAVNGKIVLKVEAGTERVGLMTVGIDNATMDGPIEVDFTIEFAGGSVKKGNLLTQKLAISDDESKGIAKGYVTTWDKWKSKRFFGYRPDGQIDRIYWEQHTPFLTSGHYNYYYKENGQLEKMTSNLSETRYFYENSRIVKEEEYQHGVLTRYIDYRYDRAGNVSEARRYYRRPSGEMEPGSLIEYQYFDDGNLHRQLTYHLNASAEPVLFSTIVYGNYLIAENPFPLEILPNINAQPSLPGSYTQEQNGMTLKYNFTYEFDGGGKPVKRTTSSSTGTEVSVYHYF